MDSHRVGRFGHEPQGEVLLADEGGPEATAGGNSNWEKATALVARFLETTA